MTSEITAPEPSDASLADLVRAGDGAAYTTLWERHAKAGRTVARNLGSADPDDLVSEAYTVILGAMKRGFGPTGAFRPYLFTTIRNLSMRWTSGAAVDSNVDDDVFANLEAPEPGLEFAEKTITVSAFRSLPERWKTVLWYTEVEQMQPREVGLMMGMNANSVAALAYRAREGLRQAWLQAHINSATTPDECRWASEHMGENARGTLSRRDSARFDDHVSGCARCSILIEELEHVAGRLAVMLLPILIGGVAASGYLASLGGGAPAGTQASTSQGVTTPRRAGRVLATAGGALVVGAIALGAVAATGAFTPAPATTVTAPVAQPVDTPAPEPTPEPVITEMPAAEEPTEVDATPPVSPKPAPVVPPKPPADVTVAPPTITAVPAGELTFLPTLSGSAERGATVTVRDESSAVIATVTADANGDWSTTLAGVQPHDGQVLTARQKDRAGNLSTPSPGVGPYTFAVPSFPALVNGGTTSWATYEPAGAENGTLQHVVIAVAGVIGQRVLIYVDGHTSGTFHTLNTAVITRISPDDLPAGIHTFAVRYADGYGKLGLLTQVSVTTGP
jgi:RNA polymerase sigma factor (sigma-70 family)